jgi:hypothetical protein
MFGGSLPSEVALAVALLAWAPPSHAKVTKIVIDSKTSPAFCDAQSPIKPCLAGQTAPSFGSAGQFEIIRGRAFGELDPKNPLNAIVQDIELGKDPDGKVRYTATFQLVKPIDMSKGSHLLWQDVPNRGGRLTINTIERGNGDAGLSSGWQGDNSGTTAQNLVGADGVSTNDWVAVPIAKQAGGKPVTGTVLGRIVNRSGPASQGILVQSSPLPYKPFTLDTSQATLTTHTRETMDGRISVGTVIPDTDWAWAKCASWTDPKRTPDGTQICLKNGYDGNLLYQVVFTARDPYVLGVGFAAFRDVGFFFKTAVKDDAGTLNPLANANQSGTEIKWSISRGVSQSGNFLRGFLHLGFNQAENGKQVHDGTWPIIAGRRIALNFRWAQPDGVLELYQAGSEGPQWWSKYEDDVRGLPKRGILDRCKETRTCPKVIEHFGAAEVWELKLPIEWVGTDAKKDIPLPRNVRRYYIPSTTHGGGGGGFLEKPTAAARCPGNTYGGVPVPDPVTGVPASPAAALPANPVPHTETVNAIRFHFRSWVMTGKEPPPSLYPTLRANALHRDDDGDDEDDDDGHDGRKPDGFLVEPTKRAMGFPDIPALMDPSRPSFAPDAPEAGRFDGKPELPFINPVLDYDWGPEFNPSDGSGVPTKLPPPIRRVIKMMVPRVDADGNELGGVPVVLRDAPLGTYLGWNITVSGFHKGQNCNYTGGVIPFARTKAERDASKDPRPSLQERYTDHAGYVAAVRAAAANAVKKSFLLQADADALIAQADASNVLK